jgi:hypothetical protein
VEKKMHKGDSRSKNDPKPPLFEAKRRKLLRKKLWSAHQKEERENYITCGLGLIVFKSLFSISFVSVYVYFIFKLNLP